jgi:hypothetical protein
MSGTGAFSAAPDSGIGNGGIDLLLILELGPAELLYWQRAPLGPYN